jgi:lysozyme
MPKKSSPNLEAMILRHEGESLIPYTDTVGKLTIGVGRNLTDRGITAQESRMMMDRDIREVQSELMSRLPVYVGLDDVRKAALVDLGFNMGVPTLLTFELTLGFLGRGEYDQAADELLAGSGPNGESLYYLQVGVRAEEISEMIRTGEWPKPK